MYGAFISKCKELLTQVKIQLIEILILKSIAQILALKINIIILKKIPIDETILEEKSNLKSSNFKKELKNLIALIIDLWAGMNNDNGENNNKNEVYKILRILTKIGELA